MNYFYLTFILVAMTSCGVLKPVRDDSVRLLLESGVPESPSSSSSPVVAIARPTLPSYLDRFELVTRNTSGTLDLHEKEIWAESLDKGISRVVAENLRRLTKSNNIQPVENFISQEYATLVEIRVDRFEATSDGVVVFECTWKAQPVPGNDVGTKPYRVTLPFQHSGLNHKERGQACVAVMNEALERFSREIAKQLAK